MVHADVDQAALDGAADDREADRGREHLWEERDDVDVQEGHVALFDRLRRLLPSALRPPGVPSGPLARGTRALERGQLDAAEAAFAEALASASTAAEVAVVRNKRAILAIRRGDRDGAVRELIEALEALPRSPAAITTVGNMLLEDGMIPDAIAHYEYALLIDGDYAPAYHNLGVALHRSGRRGEAVRMLRKATRLEGRIKRT
jgi:tetratricopeptide (TPR) repeat protein